MLGSKLQSCCLRACSGQNVYVGVSLHAKEQAWQLMQAFCLFLCLLFSSDFPASISAALDE
jgi:hypothetical protein